MKKRPLLVFAGQSNMMGACVYPLSLLGFGDFVTLVLQVLVGVIVYAAGSALFKLDSFMYLLSMVKRILHRKGE